MRWFLVILSCAYASAEYRHFYSKPQTAASEAQVKFAIENNYDDTGPGAKQRETAYNTYTSLDEALLSYIDDPDTKLPEFEKVIALNKLLKSNKVTKVIRPYLPKQVIDFPLKPLEEQSIGFDLKPSYDAKLVNFGIKPVQPVLDLNKPSILGIKPVTEFGNKPILQNVDLGIKPTFEDSAVKKEFWNFKHGIPKDKISFMKASPLNLGFYSREGESRAVTPSSLYSLVYDVNEKRQTTPISGQGDYLRGYYSLKDSDGKTRIIQYSVNHKGYSASERRSDHGRLA